MEIDTHTFILSVAKIDAVLFEGPARSCVAPGEAGVMTILAGHMPLVSTLKAGTIAVVAADGATQEIPLEKGVLEVAPDRVTVLVG